MAMEQKMGLRLSQLQLRYVGLLEMTAPELDEAIERELEDNPALEADSDTVQADNVPETDNSRTERYYSSGAEKEESNDYVTPDTSETLRDHMYAQIAERTLPDDIDQALRYLIDSLDSNGYLRTPPSQLRDDMAFYHSIDMPEETLLQAIDILKTLDPPGVGAADLRESLLLQLKALPRSETVDNATAIITGHFEAFTMNHFHRLVSALRKTPQQIEQAVSLIRSLNPKPGAAYSSDAADNANVIIPDFVVWRDENTGKLAISLNNSIPELRIEESFAQAYARLRRDARGRLEKGSEFIAARYGDAADFIRILRRRQETMHTVMTAIVALQKEYFDTEDVYRLRPMMIKDIAAITGLDISTISRATANKFVALPWGVFPLRFFFSDTMSAEADSDAVTNRKIEAAISKVVAEEDKRHPLSDEKIRQALAEAGFELSRRTVTKYRERVRIPVARLRRQM